MPPAPPNELERRVLRQVLAINAAMWIVELSLGLAVGSIGLVADSFDMLADAAVYGLALYATSRATSGHLTAARLSGVIQILLGAAVLAESLRRFLMGSDPVGPVMIGVGAVALVANVTCLILMARFRRGRIHMRAAWIFSSNDVLANLGVILSGVLVTTLGSRLPDLVIGAAIAVLVVRGGFRILRQAASEVASGGTRPGHSA
ncbi:MAG: cation transporter [Gemmatimonadales bacterium]